MDVFDLETARRDLIAKRVAAGADSPIGHRCSNLIEQLEHYQTATGDQRANLAKSIQRSADRIQSTAPVERRIGRQEDDDGYGQI